jgi:hypothetical protein
LLNLKRVAYGLRPAVASPGVGAGPPPKSTLAPSGTSSSAGPQAPAKPAPRGISADELRSKVDQFLTSRGYKAAESGRLERTDAPPATVRNTAPVAFVCEDDVREAIRAGTTIALGEKTIVTPAARDPGQAHNVFTLTSWPR